VSDIGRSGGPDATDGAWRQSADTPGPDGYPHYSSWPPRQDGHWAAPPPPPRRRGPFGALLALVLVALLAVAAVGVGRGILHSGALSAFTSSDTALAEPGTDSGTDQVEEPARAALGETDLTALAAKVAPGLVNINTELGYQNAASAGTGIVLTSNGEVLTNNHVINGATSIRATNAANGRTYQASVVGRDRDDDIAVLQLSGASGLRTAKIGDSDAVAVGDQIAAVGNADGANVRPSVATGKVTALGRSISAHDELTGRVERLSGLIEVDANVRPGDSGGPLVNTAGEVVGVDTAASGNFRVQAEGGTGYAIPINSALTIARRIASGRGSGVPRIRPAAMLDLGVLAPLAPLTPLGPAVEPLSAGAGQPWAASVQPPVRTVSLVSTQPPGRLCATDGVG
jgi:S1-C subfamily serine protease